MPQGQTRREHFALLGALVVAGNAADLDFIPGVLIGDPGHFHRGASHSLLAIVAFTGLMLVLARRIGCRSYVRVGLVLGLAFAGHLFVDMFSSWVDDHSGVALAWPLSSYRLLSPYPIFKGISLYPGAQTFLEGVLHRGNLYAVLWEFVVVGAVWGLVRLSRASR
jgi:inner membrane protein